MSRIFYDHLVVFEEIDIEIKKASRTKEEQEELWNLVDEIIHHRVMGCILDVLPREHHEEFLNKFHQAPHDEGHINFLNEKTEKDIEGLLRKELKNIEKELVEEIKGK